MNSNWGLVDPLDRRVKDKKEKRRILGERAQLDFLEWMRESGLDVADPAMVVTPSAD